MNINVVALLTTFGFLLLSGLLAALSYALILAGHPAFASLFGGGGLVSLFIGGSVEVVKK